MPRTTASTGAAPFTVWGFLNALYDVSAFTDPSLRKLGLEGREADPAADPSPSFDWLFAIFSAEITVVHPLILPAYACIRLRFQLPSDVDINQVINDLVHARRLGFSSSAAWRRRHDATGVDLQEAIREDPALAFQAGESMERLMAKAYTVLELELPRKPATIACTPETVVPQFIDDLRAAYRARFPGDELTTSMLAVLSGIGVDRLQPLFHGDLSGRERIHGRFRKGLTDLVHLGFSVRITVAGRTYALRGATPEQQHALLIAANPGLSEDDSEKTLVQLQALIARRQEILRPLTTRPTTQAALARSYQEKATSPLQKRVLDAALAGTSQRDLATDLGVTVSRVQAVLSSLGLTKWEMERFLACDRTAPLHQRIFDASR